MLLRLVELLDFFPQKGHLLLLYILRKELNWFTGSVCTRDCSNAVGSAFLYIYPLQSAWILIMEGLLIDWLIKLVIVSYI